MNTLTQQDTSGPHAVVSTKPAADPNAAAIRTALEAKFVREHGPHLAALMADSLMAARAKEIERQTSLNAQLIAAKEALENHTVEGTSRLKAASKAMELARVEWEKRCGDYEAERLRQERGRAPLRNAIYDLVQQINGFDLSCGGKVKQWDFGPHVPQPVAPPGL